MHVSALRLELELTAAPSAAAARRAVRSIASHLRKQFAVSSCDLDPLDPEPRRAGLAVAVAAPTKRDAHEILDRLVDALRAHPHATLVDSRIRIRDLG
jgi:uncharacterized protein YlxP (DUF503 family)